MKEIDRTIRILNKIIRMAEDDTNNNIKEYCLRVKNRIELEVEE